VVCFKRALSGADFFRNKPATWNLYDKGIFETYWSVRGVFDAGGIGVGANGIAKPIVERFVGQPELEHQTFDRNGKGWRAQRARVAVERRGGE